MDKENRSKLLIKLLNKANHSNLKVLQEKQEKDNKELVSNGLKYLNSKNTDLAKDVLVNNSIAPNSIYSDSFDNFNTNTKTLRIAKYEAIRIAKYFSGEQISKESKPLTVNQRILSTSPTNIVFSGDAGRGKSHLAYAILRYVNDHIGGRKFNGKRIKCLFINVNKLMDVLKHSFSEDNNLDADEILQHIQSAYLVVLDDFGTEINPNSQGANNGHTDMSFTQRVMYNILDNRSRTIFTTNLSDHDLETFYDERIYSRININKHLFPFIGIPDYRKQLHNEYNNELDL